MKLRGFTMDSRRLRVQEKRSARRGILFLILSALLLILFFTLGIQALSRITNLATNLKKDNANLLQADKTAPTPPQFQHHNFSTNQENILIQARAEASSEVRFYKGSELLKTLQLGDRAQFELDVTLEKGKNDFWLTATDAAGNTSEKSSTLTLIYDPDPPEIELTSPQESSEFYGSEKTITVEGKTDPEAKVTVNERIAINSEGLFSTRITLNDGKNEIKVVATDTAENKTEKILTVSYSP